MTRVPTLSITRLDYIKSDVVVIDNIYNYPVSVTATTNKQGNTASTTSLVALWQCAIVPQWHSGTVAQ